MEPKVKSEVIGLLRRRLDQDEYRSIRQLWIAHSIAENSRDIPGLMATLTEDCIYTVVNKGVDWQGSKSNLLSRSCFHGSPIKNFSAASESIFICIVSLNGFSLFVGYLIIRLLTKEQTYR
jgi:hypothetical protein